MSLKTCRSLRSIPALGDAKATLAVSTKPAVATVSFFIMLHLLPCKRAKAMPARAVRKLLKERRLAAGHFLAVLSRGRLGGAWKFVNNRHRAGGAHGEDRPQRHKDTENLCVSVSPWLIYSLRSHAASVNSRRSATRQCVANAKPRP